MLTVSEVAALLRVCKHTVYRMVKRGELPAVRAGRAIRIPESAVTARMATPIAA